MASAGGGGSRRFKGVWAVAALVATGLACAAVWVGSRYFRSPLALATEAYVGGDYSHALADARQILKEHPDSLAARRLMARSSARLQRDEVALQMYDRLGREKMEAEDFYLVGTAMTRMGRRDAAQDALQSAYRIDPSNPEIAYELARLYAGSDRLAEAATIAKQLAMKPGWGVRAQTTLGLLREQASDPKGAADAFEEALRRDPNLTGAIAKPNDVRKLLARALLSLRRPNDARVYLQTVLRAGPDAEASWLLSRAALQRGDLAAAEAARKDAGDYGQDQPHAFEPAAFIGASTCTECHRDVHRLAGGTRHAKTSRPSADLARFPLPKGPLKDPANSTVVHTLERTGDRVTLETRAGTTIRRALLEYAVGSGDRGLTPVARDESGQMRELRLSYYGDIAGWDRTMGRPEHPSDEADYLGEPLSEDAVRRCLDCHVTNFRATLDHTGPVAEDRGIGCERCHGPAGNHLLAVAAKFTDPAIGRPRLASPQQVTNLCGQCHRPRNRDVKPTDMDAVRFQAVTLPWSRCSIATNGAFGCVTCHSPHRDADTSSAYYDAKCLACHAAEAPPPAPPTAHRSRHTAALPEDARRVACPINAKSDCVECHMPSVTSAAPHTAFTDHFIRIHPRTADRSEQALAPGNVSRAKSPHGN